MEGEAPIDKEDVGVAEFVGVTEPVNVDDSVAALDSDGLSEGLSLPDGEMDGEPEADDDEDALCDALEVIVDDAEDVDDCEFVDVPHAEYVDSADGEETAVCVGIDGIGDEEVNILAEKTLENEANDDSVTDGLDDCVIEYDPEPVEEELDIGEYVCGDSEGVSNLLNEGKLVDDEESV